MYIRLIIDLVKEIQEALIEMLFEMLDEKNTSNEFIVKMRWFVMPAGKNRKKVINIIEKKTKKISTIENKEMQIVDIDDGSHAWVFEVDVETARELKDKRLEMGLDFRVFVQEDGDRFVREDLYIYGSNLD